MSSVHDSTVYENDALPTDSLFFFFEMVFFYTDEGSRVELQISTLFKYGHGALGICLLYGIDPATYIQVGLDVGKQNAAMLSQVNAFNGE